MKVSIVIPTYNVEKYIARCLDSVINQTLKEIEIIVVDDKSTDNTLSIVKDYASRDNRIKVIELFENQGVSVARNTGIDLSTGEYIGFIDPDDYVDLDFYEKLYARAIETDAEIIKGSVILTDMNNGNTITPKNEVKIKEHVAYFNNAFWSAIYKSGFIKDNNVSFPVGVITSQDSVFLTIVGLLVKKFEMIDGTKYHYFYQRPGSLDSAVLPHHKANSKCNAFGMNLRFVANSGLSKDELIKFFDTHVLSHINYEINKGFELDEDRERLFNLLVTAYDMKLVPDSIFKEKFGRNIFALIKKGNYREFREYKNRRRIRIQLFGAIPFIRFDIYEKHILLDLFDFLPLLKIVFESDKKQNRMLRLKFYLFRFILILKMRG